MTAMRINRCSPAAESRLTGSVRGSHARTNLDNEGGVATVRERTSSLSQVVTLIAVVVPPFGAPVGDGPALGRGVQLARPRSPRRALRRLRVRDDDRIPPLLHAQGLRDRTGSEGALRHPRLHDDAGPADPVGDRPSQAPRALGSGGRSALAARRSRRRCMERHQGLRSRARRLALHAEGPRARTRVRQGSLRGPARADDRPALHLLGRPDARDPVR